MGVFNDYGYGQSSDFVMSVGGGMVLKIGAVTVTSVACALILGIIINLISGRAIKKELAEKEEVVADKVEQPVEE